MALETNNHPDGIETLVKSLFGISELPKHTPTLLDHSAKFTQDTVLQLILYGEKSDWEWYANMEKYCKGYTNHTIKNLLYTIYTYVENPKYIPDDDDLPGDSRGIYDYVIRRISQSPGPISPWDICKARVGNIFDIGSLPNK